MQKERRARWILNLFHWLKLNECIMHSVWGMLDGNYPYLIAIQYTCSWKRGLRTQWTHLDLLWNYGMCEFNTHRQRRRDSIYCRVASRRRPAASAVVLNCSYGMATASWVVVELRLVYKFNCSDLSSNSIGNGCHSCEFRVYLSLVYCKF